MYLSSKSKLIICNSRRALEAMSFAYFSKNMNYPVSKLKTDLIFNSRNEAIKECKVYNIVVNSEDNVQFVKRVFTAEEVTNLYQ